jgi:hypothetical protein
LPEDPIKCRQAHLIGFLSRRKFLAFLPPLSSGRGGKDARHATNTPRQSTPVWSNNFNDPTTIPAFEAIADHLMKA